MLMMQKFQDEGIRTYEQASRKLQSLNVSTSFDTPKHHVTILSMCVQCFLKFQVLTHQTCILPKRTVLFL
jgi:hypothetical protein